MSPIVSLLLGSAAVAAPSATTAAAACAVVERYYAALDRRDYRTAYRAWAGSGRASGQRFTQFVRGFASTRHTGVAVGPPDLPEGGAGSIYVDVPVTVHATLKNGSVQRFAGTYTLRRVNDVDGSTAEQRTWHIDGATLHRQ